MSLIGTRRIPEEWLSALWLPESEEGGIPENMRGVCLQQLIGAWACLISIEGYGFDLPVCQSHHFKDMSRMCS